MSRSRQFKKRPVVIEAMQWDGTVKGATSIIDWIRRTGSRSARWDSSPKHLPGPGRGITTIRDRIEVETLEGTMYATPGDWIIRGVSNEHYPCKDSVFRMTYEEVKS